MIENHRDLVNLKKLCRETMPTVARMHAGIDPSRSLTEYQIQMQGTPEYHMLFALGDETAARDMMMINHTYARWLKFGMSIFRPTPDLFASLVLTDPTNVEPEVVKPPFPTFFVHLPPKTFYSSGLLDGTDEELSLVMINHVQTVPKEVREGPISLQEARSERHIDLINFMMMGPTVFLIDSLPVLGRTDWSMEDWLTRNQPKKMWMDAEQDERDLCMRLAFRRFYVNFCLYISERGMGVKQKRYTSRSAARRAKKKGAPKKMNPETWVIGKEVKIGKDLLGAAQDYINSGRRSSSGWKIKKRCVVRGHWRNQACGPRWTQTKRVWIEPFWRGPKEGSKVQHIYTTDKGRS